VLDQPADADGRNGPGVAPGDPDPLPNGRPTANRRHVMTKYPQLAIGRPGHARQQIDDRRSVGWVGDLDAERGLAVHRLSDAEASRTDGPAAAAPDADPGGKYWVRAHDHMAGWQGFPRI
jgi:hypothetical protein